MRIEILETIGGNIGLLFISILGLSYILLKKELMRIFFKMILQEGIIVSIGHLKGISMVLVYIEKENQYYCLQSLKGDCVGKKIYIYSNGMIAVRKNTKDVKGMVFPCFLCLIGIIYSVAFIWFHRDELEIILFLVLLIMIIFLVIVYPFIIQFKWIRDKEIYMLKYKDDILNFSRNSEGINRDVWMKEDNNIVNKKVSNNKDQKKTDNYLICICLCAIAIFCVISGFLMNEKEGILMGLCVLVALVGKILYDSKNL